MHANSQKPCLSWTALALIATSISLSSGCAKLQHAWHYNYVTRSLTEHRLSYYHSPGTGRIIPDEHHAVPPMALPCFGYESTCWHQWPEECTNCPVHESDGMILGDLYHGPGVIEGEIISGPVEAVHPAGETEAVHPAGDVDSHELEHVAPTGEASPLPSTLEDLNSTPSPTDGAERPEANTAASDTLAKLSRRTVHDIALPTEPVADSTPTPELPVAVVAGHASNEVSVVPKQEAATSADAPADREPDARRSGTRRSSRRVRHRAEQVIPLVDSKPPTVPTEQRKPGSVFQLSVAKVSTGHVATPAAVVNRHEPVRRHISSRRVSRNRPTLPSFKIVPVLTPLQQTVAAPIQLKSGASNTLRFLSEYDQQPIHVVDQSATDTALRFR